MTTANVIYIVGVLGPPPILRTSKSPTVPLSNFHRITNQKAREQLEKGLYYYCDEKFIPDHRYEHPQLCMIEKTTDQEPKREIDAPQEKENHKTVPEISFHAIADTNHP